MLPTRDAALALMGSRKARLTVGKSNLCAQYNGRTDYYAPFTYSKYVYAGRMGYLGDEPWLTIVKQDPASLLVDNPFEPSKYRRPGLAIWDSVVGIKACRRRNPYAAIGLREIPITSTNNQYWDKKLCPAINRIGPLGPNGTILRPEDEYIIDLTKMGEMGYRIRLAAHALAHMHGDKIDAERSSKKKVITRLTGFIEQFTAELVTAYIYGLPFNTALRLDIRNDCSFKQYGINVKTSTQFENPVLKVPWNNNGALAFDETLAVLNVAIFIEPHPFGWTTRTMQYTNKDHWCCSPTIVMITGWELVDFITHQPLVSSNPDNHAIPVCYGVHPLDLMGPDQFWSYLAMANTERGAPKYTAELRDVEEWLYSDDFTKLINTYPPLPCGLQCMTINDRAEGAPVRPRDLRPFKKGTDKVLESAWDRYDKECKSLKKVMLEPAVKNYEAIFYGNRRESLLRRRTQIDNYKRVRRVVDEQRIWHTALMKIKEGKDLNARELRVKAQYEASLQKTLDVPAV